MKRTWKKASVKAGRNWVEEDRETSKAFFHLPILNMTPFEAYILYLGLREHFSGPYDFFKYNGKVTATPEAFKERNDKQYFTRLANSTDPQGMLLSNILVNPKLYIRQLAEPEAKSIYEAWKKRKENLLKETKRQLSKLDGNVNDWLIVKDNQHPALFKAYLKNLVDMETLLVVESACKYFSYWEDQIVDPIVFKTKYMTLKKYQPFVMIDDEKAKEMLLSLHN